MFEKLDQKIDVLHQFADDLTIRLSAVASHSAIFSPAEISAGDRKNTSTVTVWLETSGRPAPRKFMEYLS